MKYLILLSITAFLGGCGHTVRFPSSHFATPVTAESQWGGSINALGSAVTKVTLISDKSTNPPDRTITINEEVDAGDFLPLFNLGLNGSLSVIQGTEVFFDNSLLGVRFQFLNHGAGTQKWVASILGAYGSREVSTSTTYNNSSTDKANSKVITTQAGISLGYKLEHIVPYFSYIYEFHDISTDVTNPNGSFGPYKDQGVHQYYALGISSHGRGFTYGAEYNRIQIKWDRSTTTPQDALGLKLGFSW